MTMHKNGIYRSKELLGNKTTYTHRIPARWADQVYWLLTIEGTVGAPASASIRVTPQIAAMHTRNQLEDSRYESSTQGPLWVNAPDSMLPDGRPGEVATQTIGEVNVDGSTCVVIPFRQVGGYWSRLAIDISTTAGDLGGFKISLEAVLTK